MCKGETFDMHNNIYKILLTVLVAMVAFTGLIAETTYAQSYDVDESGNVVFYSPDGSQSVSKENLIKPNHGVVLFGYQNTYTDVIDASVLPRALGNNRAIANSETRIGRYYSTLSQGEIHNTGFDIGQVHQGQVASGNESWAYSHLAKINQLRYEHGLAPVSINLDASGYAFSKSQDMIQNGYFAHQNPEGDSIITQYLSFNPDDSNVHAVGENMAQAYPSTATSIEAQVFDDLLHSPGHYQNMVDPAWDSVGLGFYYDPSVSSKVYFVQLFYTTDYSAKNGLSAEGLANSYWNYEFYQKDNNPEAFETIVAEVPVEEEVVEEEIVEEEVIEEEVVEETAIDEDFAQEYEENEQLVETLRAEVEEKRQAQSEASDSLAANQAEIERVELENAAVVEPYRSAETLIEEKTIELEATTDPALREQLEAEIAEANVIIKELQPQMDEVNILLNPLTEQQVELENTVAERAEEKRIAEEALVEQSDKLATMTPPEQVDTTVEEGTEVTVGEDVTMEEEVVEEGETEEEVVEEGETEVTEEEDETLTESVEEVVEEEATEESEDAEESVENVEVTFESDEEPTTSEYNVNLSNNIVEVPQNNTPPEVANRSESEEPAAETEEEETVEETEALDEEVEEETDEVEESSEESVDEESAEDSAEELEEEQTVERNLSDLVGRSDTDDSSNDEVSGVLPDTGLAENPWLIVGAIALVLVGGALIVFTVIRRK